MKKAVMEMMNNMTSLLWEQQAYLKEAMALLLDICPTAEQLMDQAGLDETKILELQEQIRRWRNLCSDLSEQNEVLTKQNQELLILKRPLMPEEGSGNSMNNSGRKENSSGEDYRDMTREELLEELASEKRATRILSTQKISLRQLIVRLNEENEMLLSLWEEAEKKYGNAKSAYDDLWNSYEQMRGLYETARRKNRDLQKDGLQPKP